MTLTALTSSFHTALEINDFEFCSMSMSGAKFSMWFLHILIIVHHSKAVYFVLSKSNITVVG